MIFLLFQKISHFDFFKYIVEIIYLDIMYV